MKSYRSLIPIVSAPILVICGILTYFPSVTVRLFQVHWLSLLAAFVIAIGPWGKLRLAAEPQEPPRYARWSWLGQIFILQLCFAAVFLGICVVCGQTAPILTPPQTALFQQTLTQLLVNEGLFPWSFAALLAISFGFHSYSRRQDAYLATAVSSIMQNPTVKVIINFIGRLMTMMAYSSTLCLISLLWASITTTSAIITGFALTPLLVTTLLLLLSRTKIYRRNLTQSLGKNIPFALGLFFWTALFAVAIWLLNGFLAPFTAIPMAPPSLLSYWLAQPWEWLWQIFANSWWLLWLPILAITIARISQGYRVWEVVAATLAFPFIASVILACTRQWHGEISVVTANLVAGVGLLGLLFFTLRKKAVPTFILVYLPRSGHYKFRSYRSILVKLTQIAAGFLFIYLPGGMIIIHFLFLTVALPALLIALSSIPALCRDIASS